MLGSIQYSTYPARVPSSHRVGGPAARGHVTPGRGLDFNSHPVMCMLGMDVSGMPSSSGTQTQSWARCIRRVAVFPEGGKGLIRVALLSLERLQSTGAYDQEPSPYFAHTGDPLFLPPILGIALVLLVSSCRPAVVALAHLSTTACGVTATSVKTAQRGRQNSTANRIPS